MIRRTEAQKDVSSLSKNVQLSDNETCSTTNAAIGDGQSEKKNGFKILTTLSGKGKYTLLFATSSTFLAGVMFSLIGPIFPFEASRKGMGPTLIGIVFGLFGVFIFLTAPIFGSFLTKLGPKFTFISGIFVGGCCNILFGTLYYCPGGTPFIVMSILIRSIEAIGFSAYITSSFAIVSSEFKENIGFVFGILETGFGLGSMLGPTIGGALYELGGFCFPFYAAGALVLVNGLLAYNFLPEVENVQSKRKGSMLTLFRSPMVAVSITCLMLGEIGVSTYFSTFAKHVEELNISVGTIGYLFGFVGLLYSVTSMLLGYISDTLDYQAPLMIGGQLIFGVGFLILGPSFLFPFIPFNMATVFIGLVSLGLSFGGVFIPAMKCMVTGAVELGFENNVDTYALVSGLFNSAVTLGSCLGPVAIGALIQGYGYPVAYTVVGVIPLVMMFVCVVFFTSRYFRKRRSRVRDEYENLDANEKMQR